MVITIDDAYVQTFESNVRVLAQQSEARLRKYVQERGESSKNHNWDRIGEQTASQKTAARTTTPQNDSPWSRRVTVPQTWHAGDTVEPEDVVQMLIEPKSPIARVIAMALKRKLDDLILTAATGTSLDGDGNSVAYDTNQTIGNGTAEISLSLVLQVQQLFIDNDIDPDEPKIMLIGPLQQRKMLLTEEFTSGDYQIKKALATGILPNYLGFTWIVHTGLKEPAANQKSCVAFTEWALAGNINKDIWARAAERPDQSFNWQLYSAFTAGYTRVQDEHLVHLHVADTVT